MDLFALRSSILHTPQYAFRGTGMDRELQERLKTYTFPEEAKYADTAYAAAACGQLAAQMKKARWAEAEPDIPLIRAEWDCYAGSAPQGIDVVMFDAVMLDQLIAAGWIRPIDPHAVQDPGDLFPFALDGLTALSVQDGAPQYLLLARRSPYRYLSGLFPLYAQLEALAGDEHSRVIRTP